MYVSCFIVAFYLVWCVGYVRINITLSFLIYSQNYPILYYFIVLMVGYGTYTLIHIVRLDIRQIREVEHGNFIGIYLRLRKCKTPMYKLILNYAHMYATCSSREGGMPHITLLYYSHWSIIWFWNFYMESVEIMTLNFQVSKYY